MTHYRQLLPKISRDGAVNCPSKKERTAFTTMSEAQTAGDAVQANSSPSPLQDGLSTESTPESAVQSSGDAPTQSAEKDTKPVASEVEPVPVSLASHMAGDKAEPAQLQEKPDLPSGGSSEPQPNSDSSTANGSVDSPCKATQDKPSSEPTESPTPAELSSVPSEKSDSSHSADAASPPAAVAPPAEAPAEAPGEAPAEPPAAPPAEPPAAPPADSGQDDSGCDTEPEPERQSSAPASMAERRGPEMADVEKLARSVVSDTLEKAKQEASLQRSLDNRRQDPDTDDDGWLDIVGNGQLKKKVLTAGRGDRSDRPQRSQLASVHLSAHFEDGRPVSGLPERLTFGLGDGEVITGLDMAVGLMQPGETAEVYMDARFAYGEKGLDDAVPPNTNLIFTVQLESVQPEPKYEEMSAEQRLEIGSQKRDRGNWWFKREDFNHAIQCYRRALDFFDNESDEFTGLPDDVHLLFEERLKVHNNMAAAQMKLEAYDAALRSLQLVLTCQPNNVKALFRKGKVLMAQNQVADAAETLREALKHSPDNRTVQAELNRVLGVQRKQAEEQKSMYRKMLGLPPAEERPASAQATKKSFPVKLLVAGVACALAAIAVHRLKLF
ncbi:peptidyl-prolyl cis-trans isomerase FKBP8-like isoform X4 [Amphibalanus amphitrite]|uniref:peptidyl-prolyl cis-trans isomerase FKBP8-like isoform X4 n=2 Tax=Amphibalanus amphitrite TaxID=1232801 RepID=UPI001C903760|nr:peptidyl-prolyl cis-trans isomerase FKBP8-like isoform X4 [Amphibalanus amphitrite]